MGLLSTNRASSLRPVKVFLRKCHSTTRARASKHTFRFVLAIFTCMYVLQRFRADRQPDLLIYVPIHLLSLSTLPDFVTCISRHTAVIKPRQFRPRVDFLIITNGNRTLQAGEKREVTHALRAIKHAVPSVRKAHAAHVILQEDTYDKNRLDNKWVAGPNELFYRVMSRDGDIHQKYVASFGYAFVQQLEADVCPIRDGWLEAMSSDMKAAELTLAVISGARVQGDTLCGAKRDDNGDDCTPSSVHPEYITQHINGNALYRMGDRLQSLLNSALELYKPWPFDLAAYLTANATGQLDLLRATPLIHNRVLPVHSEVAYYAAMYDPATYLVHISSNFLKPTQTDAAFSTLSRGLAAIVLGACASIPSSILANLHVSLQRLGVRNVVWAAQPGQATENVRGLRPLAFVESAEHQPTAGVCAPPLYMIEQLITRNNSVFYLAGDAVGVGDLPKTLESLVNGNATHFASAALQSHGHYYDREPRSPRYRFTSKAFFMPATAASLRLIQTWRIAMSVAPHPDADGAINAGARCSTIANCTWDGVPLNLLSPDQFVSGQNLVKLWPSRGAIDNAVAVFDLSSNGDAAGDHIAGEPLSEGHVRFRLQHAKKWLIPKDSVCCDRVLTAPDVNVGEDGTQVRSYVDLLLQMNRTAARSGIGCVVTPAMLDARTGERVTYEVIFDPTAMFIGSQVYPSVNDAPLCPQLPWPLPMINAHSSSVDLDGWRTWSIAAFSCELRNALKIISTSSDVSSSVCVNDSQRSLAEAALHLLKGSARAVLHGSSTLRPGQQRRYAMGKWRVLDSHVQRLVPGTLTLLSPSLYPGTTPAVVFTAFGLRAQYPRLGEDVVMDVLDALVCQLVSIVTASDVPDLDMSEVYAGMLEFVDADVLKEDLAHVQGHIAHLEAAPRIPTQLSGAPPDVPRTYLIPLDTLENNGYSNTVNAAQVLAYVAKKTGLMATMVPLSMKHRAHAPRPWSDVVENVTQLYSGSSTLMPPIWAMIRHPSLLVEALDGYMLPAGTTKLWAHNSTACRHVYTRLGEKVELPCMAPSDVWNQISLSRHSSRLFQRMHVALNAAEHERGLLEGHDVIIGSKTPYLGLSDEEAIAAIGSRTTYNRRDIVLRPFRALNFQNKNAEHVEFAKSWRTSFAPAKTLTSKVDAIVQGLAPNFTCYHARVADEFMAQHRTDRPHFGAENVFKLIKERVQAQSPDGGSSALPTVYLTSDVSDPVASILGGASTVATSCSAFGCSTKDHVGWGIIDRLVCASAATFLGNIYSTFTLSVCAIRGDQKCHDLLGQALEDERLLF